MVIEAAVRITFMTLGTKGRGTKEEEN